MNGLTLLHPWGLLTLAALGVVVLIYLFYERHRPHRISGLFLWDAPTGAWRGGRRLEPPVATRSLLLDLLACALLALAVATPALTSRTGSPLVLILDGSLSMRAGGNHLRAKEKAKALLEAHDGPVVLIEAGATPRVLTPPSASSEAALAALDRYDPFDTADSQREALALARELVTGRAELHLFTDRELEMPAPALSRLERHVLAGRHPNLALIEATRRYPAFGGLERLSVAVANFAEAAARASLRVTEGAKTKHTQAIDLEPGAVFRLALELPAGTGPLEVAIVPLEGGSERIDALLEDSRALLLPTLRREVRARVDLSSAAAGAVRRALRAAGAVVLEPGNSATGEAAPAGAGVDLLVTDDLEARGARLTLAFRQVTGQATAWLGPFVIDAAHPLCQDLDLTGVYWTADPTIKAPASSDSPPLIAIERRPLYRQVGPDRLELNLDPARSNLPRSPAWPVLFANLVRACEERLPGLIRVSYPPGARLERVPYADPALNPDRLIGEGLELEWTHAAPLTLPVRPGRYALRRGGEELEAVAINALAPGESDLRGLAERDRRVVVQGTEGDGGALAVRGLGWLLAALAVGVAIVNWRLEGREAE